jgi:hypothetical protein
MLLEYWFSDATLISSTDGRLSDARTPLAHNHITLTGVTSISFASAVKKFLVNIYYKFCKRYIF